MNHKTPNTQVMISRAGAVDAGWVAELIGQAFHPLDACCWLVPDPQRRSQVLPADFRIFVDHAIAHGQVHVTGDRAGAAVWFHRYGEPLPPPAAYEQRVAAACGDATERFLHLDELFDRHHPAEPHHHLAFLAVRPDRQRRGIGSALLAHHHTLLDAREIAAYLEAADAHSRDLYLRHGYEAREPFHLPDGTAMWPMWRAPADRAASPDEEVNR